MRGRTRNYRSAPHQEPPAQPAADAARAASAPPTAAPAPAPVKLLPSTHYCYACDNCGLACVMTSRLPCPCPCCLLYSPPRISLESAWRADEWLQYMISASLWSRGPPAEPRYDAANLLLFTVTTMRRYFCACGSSCYVQHRGREQVPCRAAGCGREARRQLLIEMCDHALFYCGKCRLASVLPGSKLMQRLLCPGCAQVHLALAVCTAPHAKEWLQLMRDAAAEAP
jgi:hypothetical protein